MRAQLWRLAASCLLFSSLARCSCGSNPPPPSKADGGADAGPRVDAGHDGGSGLHVTTMMLMKGTVGTPYSAMLDAADGTAPYSWQASSGSLPNGLSLSLAGLISGTPSMAGTFTFTVSATDSTNQTATATLMLDIEPES